MCDYEEDRIEGTWGPLMITEHQRLRFWLEEHKDMLADMTVDEIADLAIAAGIVSRMTIAEWRTGEKFRRAG